MPEIADLSLLLVFVGWWREFGEVVGEGLEDLVGGFVRKAAARSGRGPGPEVRMDFLPADLPEAGPFFLVSSSWELAESLGGLAGALDEVEGPALCALSLQLVESSALSGAQVSYRRPVVEIEGLPTGVLGEMTPAA
ncbi:hypothetical protein [Streptomyces lushanensis]|uniref:hypothetical protein n=1 Tax=Streptomyces lushanensis TaxID=1434255 RepID=UPI00082F1516|nr:hypothetical protein [Streptomyces lushanensis]